MKQGLLKEADLDRALRRLIRAQLRLGVYDPPARFEAYYTTKEKGTGLGLATVKNNVELYGGRVRVESELGKGARFILSFPAKTLVTSTGQT